MITLQRIKKCNPPSKATELMIIQYKKTKMK